MFQRANARRVLITLTVLIVGFAGLAARATSATTDAGNQVRSATAGAGYVYDSSSTVTTTSLRAALATAERADFSSVAAAANAGYARSLGWAAAGFGSSSAAEDLGNTNPFAGPVDSPVNVVTPGGDVFDLEPGESMTGSSDSKWLQVRDSNGEPTGERLDNGHPSHVDPRAQAPHIHAPGVTNPDGTPWLPAR